LTAPHTPIAIDPAWRGRSGLGDYGDFVMETDAMVGRVLDAIDRAGRARDTLVLFTSDNVCAAGPANAAELEARGHFPSGPLRGYKTDVFEGGHRVPFIVRWPARVKAGATCTQLVHQADLIATLAAILDAPLPPDAGEDSFSLLPLLEGAPDPIRTHAVSCAARGVPGLRKGAWKLILAPEPGSGAPVQLYNLDVDLAESTNRAAQQPELVA